MQQAVTAIWRADRIDNSSSGDFPYSFTTHFDPPCKDNHEAVLAAAHAGCFSQSLIAELEALGLRPPAICITATVNWAGVHLLATGVVEKDGHAAFFDRAAKNAMRNCPIPKPFKAQITLSVEIPVEESDADLAV